MRNISILVALLLILQSCQTYKTVGVQDIKEGKKYRITLHNGQLFETKCRGVADESIELRINGNLKDLPKSDIDNVKQRKTSPLVVIGGVAVAAVGVFALLNKTDKESILEKTSGN
ncbi:hypothetical protein [Flagellimonas flava]|uniref:hypothetical protein n=1 Tax=Flagellimonas flava TaxID=570519 RepID=UPI003D661F97